MHLLTELFLKLPYIKILSYSSLSSLELQYVLPDYVRMFLIKLASKFIYRRFSIKLRRLFDFKHYRGGLIGEGCLIERGHKNLSKYRKKISGEKYVDIRLLD